MSGELPEPGAFAAAFVDFMQAMTTAAERPESGLLVRMRDHLSTDPRELPSTVVEFATTDHPNLQLGLDAVLPGTELLGFTLQHVGFMAVGLAELLAGQAMTGPINLGPVQYTDVDIGDGRVVQCVSSGVYLAEFAGAPIVLVVSRAERQMGFGGGATIKLEGISPGEGAVAELLVALRAAMREHNVYRGRVISLHGGHDEAATVRFHAPTQVPRDGVVLPAGTLERLEGHALGIAARAEELRAAGRHLKRGVLLHGPPGTGKTLSVSYLLSAMPGRTTILLTGRGLGLIEEALAIARELTPATVVFEDIDLVASERTMDFGDHGVLFELLNQMEGLDEDADLLFLLTTNRPDVIEPALAARPGRVDLALEIPLPDEAARGRLGDLYAGDIAWGAEDRAHVVARTEGVSGAFIKELMRQAALRAALEDRAPATGADVRASLDELLDDRSALTRRLLGQPAHGAPDDAPEAPSYPAMLHALGAAGLPIPTDLDVP